MMILALTSAGEGRSKDRYKIYYITTLHILV
jgi:hypothetical protein